MLNTIFALNTATTTATTNNPAGNWLSYLPLIIMIGAIVLMFVFSSRSQKKKDKQISDMRNALRIGDEVTTTGGIIGRVVSVKEETVVIETSRDGTKIRFLKSAIARVDVTAEDAGAAAKQENK